MQLLWNVIIKQYLLITVDQQLKLELHAIWISNIQKTSFWVTNEIRTTQSNMEMKHQEQDPKMNNGK